MRTLYARPAGRRVPVMGQVCIAGNLIWSLAGEFRVHMSRMLHKFECNLASLQAAVPAARAVLCLAGSNPSFGTG